jgi:hypothetical protein
LRSTQRLALGIQPVQVHGAKRKQIPRFARNDRLNLFLLNDNRAKTN